MAQSIGDPYSQYSDPATYGGGGSGALYFGGTAGPGYAWGVSGADAPVGSFYFPAIGGTKWTTITEPVDDQVPVRSNVAIPPRPDGLMSPRDSTVGNPMDGPGLVAGELGPPNMPPVVTNAPAPNALPSWVVPVVLIVIVAVVFSK